MIRDAGLSDECLLRLKKTLFIYLRMCIKQERTKVSGKPHKEALLSIRSMVAADEIQDAIASYPLSSLRTWQRVFVRMVEKRQASLLLALSNVGVL